MHNILVVDESSQACSFVIACLHGQRHTTIAATSITEATNLMRLSPADLVIVNLAMSGAIEFLSSIRGSESAGMPVIGLSDPISPQIWQQAGELGVRHFLPKEGLPVGQLQACVSDYLRAAAKSPQYRAERHSVESDQQSEVIGAAAIGTRRRGLLLFVA